MGHLEAHQARPISFFSTVLDSVNVGHLLSSLRVALAFLSSIAITLASVVLVFSSSSGSSRKRKSVVAKSLKGSGSRRSGFIRCIPNSATQMPCPFTNPAEISFRVAAR